MKLATVTALAVTTAGLAAAPAQAAISPGTFEGKTSKRDPVAFRVDDQGRVFEFSVDKVRMTCTDGDVFNSPKGAGKLTSPPTSHYLVDADGAFRISLGNTAAGLAMTVKGRFPRDGRAKGTLRLKARFNEQNRPDGAGSIRCTSGKLKWTAKRQ